MADVVEQMNVATLTTYEIDADGARVYMHVRDCNGARSSVGFPTSCLTELLMTLPRIIQEALLKSHGDDSLRVVYPIARWKIELGELGPDAIQRFILSLETDEGFAVSFGASSDLMAAIARSIFSDVVAHPSAGRSSAALI